MNRFPAPLGDHLLLVAERDQWADARIVSEPSALLVVREEATRDVALAVGEPDGVARLLAAESASRGGRGAPLWLSASSDWSPDSDVLAGLNVVAGFGWEWFAVGSPTALVPPQASRFEGTLEVLDLAREAAEVCEVLRVANPRSSANPDGEREIEWWGARADGELLGVIGAAREQGRQASGDSGFSWHLHGLGVVPTARGRGLGTALTAAITSSGFDAGADFVSLGIYSDNGRARVIYQALGYARHAAMTAYRPAGAR